MRRSTHLIVAIGLITSSLFAMYSVGSAAPQEPQPVTVPCATNVFAQPLGRGLPAAAEGQVLVLIRITIAPGGGIGPHTHPGTLVNAIESGTFGFTLVDHGEMTVMRSGEAGTPAAAEAIVPGQEITLQPGDWFVETGMVHSARHRRRTGRARGIGTDRGWAAADDLRRGDTDSIGIEPTTQRRAGECSGPSSWCTKARLCDVPETPTSPRLSDSQGVSRTNEGF